MLRIAVCDDEAIFQKKLKNLISLILNEYNIKYEISCFSSGKNLCDDNRKNSGYDILFLDVNMNGMDGLEVAKNIRQYSPDAFIIFVTAFVTYAPDGYRVNAIRYLLKNEENFEDSLKECLDTVLQKLNYKERWMTFDFQSGSRELNTDQILYIESRLHKIYFTLQDDEAHEYCMYEKLDNMQERLKGKGFCRIHQSFLVNVMHIRNIERYEAELFNGTRLSISKRHYKAIEAEFVLSKGGGIDDPS